MYDLSIKNLKLAFNLLDKNSDDMLEYEELKEILFFNNSTLHL